MANHMKGAASSSYKHGAAIRDKKNRRGALYIAWVNMRQRCGNPNKWDYKFYGGRGIKVCPRWGTFKKFAEDMGPTHVVGLTLDRIDVDLDYAPENCRWATRKVQAQNRTYNVKIEFRGKKQTLSEWIEELKLPLNWKQVYKRAITREWPLEKAFCQPLR